LRWRYHAVAEERSRIAREIHDTSAQSFAAIAFQLESSLGEADEPRPDQDRLRTALQMAKQSRKDAHVTIATLRSMQTDTKLLPMLETLLRPLCVVGNVGLLIRGEADFTPPPDVAHQILRIAQEAASNAVRHSGCKQIDVQLEQADQHLFITIADDGNGFELAPESEGLPQKHFGILGMRERARAIGALLTVQSNHSGTVVSVRLRLKERRSRWTMLTAAFDFRRTILTIRNQR
jgi:signal transduction histidine kinase